MKFFPLYVLMLLICPALFSQTHEELYFKSGNYIAKITKQDSSLKSIDIYDYKQNDYMSGGMEKLTGVTKMYHCWSEDSCYEFKQTQGNVWFHDDEKEIFKFQNNSMENFRFTNEDNSGVTFKKIDRLEGARLFSWNEKVKTDITDKFFSVLKGMKAELRYKIDNYKSEGIPNHEVAKMDLFIDGDFIRGASTYCGNHNGELLFSDFENFNFDESYFSNICSKKYDLSDHRDKDDYQMANENYCKEKSNAFCADFIEVTGNGEVTFNGYNINRLKVIEDRGTIGNPNESNIYLKVGKIGTGKIKIDLDRIS